MTMPALCSQCQSEMIYDGLSEGDPRGATAIFHCSHCDQHADVRRNGSGGMTLATIFAPPRSAADHWSFAEHQATERRMFARMRVVAGWLSEEEYEEWNAEMDRAVAEYKEAHPLPFWKRIGRRS